MRIGLISDTHIPTAGRDPSTGLPGRAGRAGLWPQVYDALRGVDLIMHAGDLYDLVVLDWLEALAPVMAVSGNGDWGGWQRTEPPTDPRLRESRVLTVDAPSTGSLAGEAGQAPSTGTGHNLRIGLVHDLPLPESPPQRTLEGLMRHYFGGPVDVIVRGSTHVAGIATLKGVLIVNPGSPTFPNHQGLRLGTVGYLDIEDGRVRPSILQLD
ncbi:MAG: metallophosphoesterase family protein [Dehalococcoidia bacterium]